MYVSNNPVNATDPMGKIARCSRTENEIRANPHFCDDSGIGSSLHSPLRCYRETVSEGTLPPWGNQCCYSEGGEFCQQSPDLIAPAVGKKGDGSCKMSKCRVAGHLYVDVYLGMKYGIKVPEQFVPPVPSVGSSCPDKYKKKVNTMSVW